MEPNDRTQNQTKLTDRFYCCTLKYYKIEDPIRDGLISKNKVIDTQLDNNHRHNLQKLEQRYK
ncbi:hypothetical protein Hanom_Chr03g00259921 [Helianthus anomalus]